MHCRARHHQRILQVGHGDGCLALHARLEQRGIALIELDLGLEVLHRRTALDGPGQLGDLGDRPLKGARRVGVDADLGLRAHLDAGGVLLQDVHLQDGLGRVHDGQHHVARPQGVTHRDRGAVPALLVDDHAADGRLQHQLPQAGVHAIHLALRLALLHVQDTLVDVEVLAPQQELDVGEEDLLLGVLLVQLRLQHLPPAVDAAVGELELRGVGTFQLGDVLHHLDGTRLDAPFNVRLVDLALGGAERGGVVLQIDVELGVIEDDDDVALLHHGAFRHHFLDLERSGGYRWHGDGRGVGGNQLTPGAHDNLERRVHHRHRGRGLHCLL